MSVETSATPTPASDPAEPALPATAGADAGESGGVRSVQRAIEILQLLDEERTTITVPEIVRETGLAKTTVVRLLQTLERNGLTWTTPQGVTAGPGLWRWAHLARRAWELPAETRELMRGLSLQTRETVNLYVRRDIHRVCVAQHQGTQTLRHVVQVGDELPLWSGASSKILLDGATGSVLERVAADSPEGSVALEALREDVQRAGEDGFAVSHGEREVGVSAVAVPVRDRRGTVLAALTISGPTARFTEERVVEFEADLRSVSSRMTERGLAHPLAH
ncbi:IclR family transcriptional regulator [Nocardioides mangrovicus]|uniref:IclR family transcriptional regulator n=1 Tax=Nocardioides mangrovicus TaxID=2478913 RepID=A0A3L8P4J7_9ACTN|nr:IclR family transcriptional regulator [Nocardioides mangrovicus]RLV50356.1 IclR family transcriptional regulator [Nocardioides mangrovicus]